MWAELINLAARLAGEVVALDRAIALPLAKAPDGRPCLVITAPDATVSAPAVFQNHGPHRVTLAGNSAAVMAAVIHSLAVCPFMANVVPNDWRAIQAGNDRWRSCGCVDRGGRIIGAYAWLLRPWCSRSNGCRSRLRIFSSSTPVSPTSRRRIRAGVGCC